MQFFTNLGQQLTDVAMQGLSEGLARGLGLFFTAACILLAVIAFVNHKFNQRSQFTSWGQWLLAALVSATITFGLERPINAAKAVVDWLAAAMGI